MKCSKRDKAEMTGTFHLSWKYIIDRKLDRHFVLLIYYLKFHCSQCGSKSMDSLFNVSHKIF